MADDIVILRSERGDVKIATDLIVDPTFGPVHLLRVVTGAGPGGGLTDAELRALAVAVSGTFWQATQPVSGPLTDAQLRAAAVPVSHGGLTDAQLRAAGVPVTHGGLTDAQLRAAGVPVTGPVTDAQLRAVAVPVSLATLPTAFGKALSFVPIAQGAAGSTELAVASAPNKHKVMGAVVTMSADGTLKFTDGAGDITGAMDIAAKGGFVLPTNHFPFSKQLRSIVRSMWSLLAEPPGVALCY